MQSRSLREGSGEVPRSDEELISVVRAGGGERDRAWGMLQEKYQNLVAAIAKKYLRREEDVDETVNAVFTKAFISLDQFNGGSFKAWLGTITRRMSINTLRDHGRPERREMGVDDVDIYAMGEKEGLRNDPEFQAIHHELGERLWDAISQLPEEMIPVVIGLGFEEKKNQEVADELKIPIGTVMSRYNRAKILLRQIVAEQEQGKEAA